MELVKRILAGVVLAVSALLFVASVVGLIGIWVVNTPVTNALLDVFGAADRTLQIGAQALDRTQSQLSAVQTRLAEAQTKLAAVGSSSVADAQVLQELKGAARDTIGPPVTQASETVNVLRDQVAFVQQVAGTMRRLPGAGIQAPAVEPVESASKTAATLAGLADGLNAKIAAVTELKQDTAASLQSSIAEISGRVAELEQQLTTAEQSIASARSSIASAQAGIPTWIDLLSLAATLVALVAALAFAVLCFHAWQVVSGRGWLPTMPQRELPAS